MTNPTTPTLTPLDQPEFSKGRQSHEMRQHFKAPGGQKLRVQVVCDSYGAQSSALIQVLDPATLRWSTLAYVPYANMQVVRGGGSAYSHSALPLAARELFFRDRDALLAQAELLLS